MSTDPQYDERALLHLIAEGDEVAFRMLFDRYKTKVYEYAFHFTRSVIQSEEIVQEIFLKVWLRKEDLTAIKKFEGWLFISTRNQCFNALKKIAYDYSYRRKQVADPEADSLEDQIVLKEYQKLVKGVVEQLPLQQKKIYTLRRDDGLRINEIAEKLGISPNTVKVQLNNALRHIRKGLEGKIEFAIILILTFFSEN